MELTEDKLLYLITNWDKKTTNEMASELGATHATIYYWTKKYREMGGSLPRKAGRPTRQLENLIAKFMITRGEQPIDPKTKQPFEITVTE